MKKIFILSSILIILTGCADYRELNDLAIITAAEIDKQEELYNITVQVVNPQNKNDPSKSNQLPFITYTETGKTLHEAVRNLAEKTPLITYGRHMQVVIISENIAKDDLKVIYDFFFRQVEIRKEFYILIDTTKKENKLLDITTPLINLPSQSIYKTLENNTKLIGTSNLITFNDLLDISLNPNKELTLPTIYIEGSIEKGESKDNIEEPKANTQINIGNMAIFKNQKMLGILNKEESLSVNLLKKQAKNFLITQKCDENNYITSELILEKSNMKIDYKNQKVKIKLKGNGQITEYNCKKDLTKAETIKELNKELNNYINNMIKTSIKNINKEYNSDIYGIKDILYKKHNNFFKKIEKTYYEDFFPNLTYEIASDFELKGKGNILGGTYEKLEN